jgi:RNA polymerase sigma factor (sigma-70 family)
VSVDRQPAEAEPKLATVQPVDLAALYQRYHDRLRRYAEWSLPSSLQHEADAALMTVFTRLVHARTTGRLKEPKNWEAFLVAAVTNACRDIVKTARDNEEIDDSDPRTHRDAEPDPTGDAAVDHLEHAARVDRARVALETLDERSRTIVIGKEGYERTNRDLGKELGLTGQRVGQLYDQALEQLREEVNRSP